MVRQRKQTDAEKREKARDRKREQRQKEAEEKEQSGISGVPKSNKPGLKNMTTEELKEYRRLQKSESRARQKLAKVEETKDDGKDDFEDDTMDSTSEVTKKTTKEAEKKPRKRQADTSKSSNVPTPTPKKACTKEIVPQRVPGGKKNCKVRIGLIDIFDVETNAIVVPYYDGHSSEDISVYQRMLTMFSKLDKTKVDSFKEDFDNNLHDKLKNYESELIDWGFQTDIGTTRRTILVKPPYLKNEKLTILSETHLRASYLSCLLTADKANINSLAFPIFGVHGCYKKSIAICLQTVFAYMESVKHTNLQLIYFVTANLDAYNDIGEFLSYIREFDLTHWTKEGLYFGYEDHVFDKFKTNVYYATIPGTDMTRRCFKLSHDRKMNANATDEALRKIHALMLKQTGINDTVGFNIYKKSARKGLIQGTQSIENGASIDVVPTFHNLLDVRFDMEHFCGSNKMLRKLWILSYYYMYFQDMSVAQLHYSPKHEDYLRRQRTFHGQKWLHRHVVQMWKDTLTKAPYKCNCLSTSDIHEHLSVFMTQLSHQDNIIKNWTLDRRCFAFYHEDDILGSIEAYQPVFIYGDGKFKSMAARTSSDFHKIIEPQFKKWYDLREGVFVRQLERLEQLMADTDFCEKVGNDHILRCYDPVKYDKEIVTGDCDSRRKKLLDALKAASIAVNNATSAEDHERSMEQFKKCETAVFKHHNQLHLNEDLEVEKCLRNRMFRFYGPAMIDVLHPNPADDEDDMDYYMDDEDDDMPDEEQLWEFGDKICTVDVYIARKLASLRFKVINVSPFAKCHNPHDSAFPTSNNAAKYPAYIDIGDRDVPCPWCGALKFACETSWNCCKNGKVWIPPMKRQPKPVEGVFAYKYRKQLTQINAAFSMASIRYNRQDQAPRGINTMKVKGVVSAHPSALNAKSSAPPRYANFIVLQCENKQIAEERAKTLKTSVKKDLARLFEEIQEYMDENNRLYESYKSMKEIEKEFLDAGHQAGYLGNEQLRFRIVSPSELSEDEMKALQFHNGVYCRPSRKGDGYISVAFTWDGHDSNMLPRGLDIFPRNPDHKDKEIEPISIFSELCDVMCYPLFYPDGLGGKWRGPGRLLRLRLHYRIQKHGNFEIK
ncbi:hypothetical protein GCK72_012178 [Caenorhabditis remanei]|uniref:Uncharacterized protein n=1 Tax=Caenorhabditis remanei TaxID=31234 RepID=A0A6A5GKA9_CAERE|nr:hypothetical protein GCK72_012178 [Caenorhabditis remanei]KAF1755728.1 hypothetical protein GCK72_012178 [Caenorhabditis remanei]